MCACVCVYWRRAVSKKGANMDIKSCITSLTQRVILVSLGAERFLDGGGEWIFRMNWSWKPVIEFCILVGLGEPLSLCEVISGEIRQGGCWKRTFLFPCLVIFPGGFCWLAGRYVLLCGWGKPCVLFPRGMCLLFGLRSNQTLECLAFTSNKLCPWGTLSRGQKKKDLWVMVSSRRWHWSDIWGLGQLFLSTLKMK